MQERIFSRADGEVFVKMDVIHEQHGEDGRGGRARTWPVTRLRALTGSRFQAEEDGMEGVAAPNIYWLSNLILWGRY